MAQDVVGDEGRGKLGTIRNAAVLLDLLSDGPAYQQLTDLAERSGLAVPTAHRLLRSLVLADLVEQDARTSRYSLGPEVARLSQRYLGRLPLLSALSPYLLALRDTLQTTIHVAVLVRESVVYVDRVDALHGGPYRESHRVANALDSPSGRLLVSRAPDEVWLRCLEHRGSLPGAGERDRDAVRQEWRAAAYLASDESTDALPEVAVPVVDSGGVVLAALAASLSAAADPERVAQQLTRAAAAAGRTLGHG